MKDDVKERLLSFAKINGVDIRTAILVRALGFDSGTIAYYNDESQLCFDEDSLISNFNERNDIRCSCPTFEQVIDWLRKEHDMIVYVKPSSLSVKYFQYVIEIVEPQNSQEEEQIANSGGIVLYPDYPFRSYREAMKKGVVRAVDYAYGRKTQEKIEKELVGH